MTNEAAEIVAPCADLSRALEFFVEKAGFRLDMIMPADAPSVAVVSRGGARLRLETSGERANLTVVVRGENLENAELVSPDGVVVVIENDALKVPALANELVVAPADGMFHEGRAGMRYRDLLPTRLGGAVIASHISIPHGGPIADYVHFHKIKFQIIYCLSGRARLVYEDYGAPFWFEAGDCVLQPPEIRHQVLECSDGFAVLEVGAPAIHETFRDHDMLLGQRFTPDRTYRGQRFRHHRAEEAVWNEGVCDTGIHAASNGAVDVRVIRSGEAFKTRNEGGFMFYFIVRGEAKLRTSDGQEFNLEHDAAVNLPEGEFEFLCEDAEIIQITAPF